MTYLHEFSVIAVRQFRKTGDDHGDLIAREVIYPWMRCLL